MYIIVWRGLGILVPIVMIACIVSTNYLVDLAMKDPDYAKWTYWPKALGAVFAALAVWIIGRKLNSRSIRTLRGHITPSEPPKEIHSMFGIDFEYWAFLPLAFSVIGYYT